MKISTRLASCLAVVALASPLGAATQPNVIFILADDLGLDGVSCYGADKHKTQTSAFDLRRADVSSKLDSLKWRRNVGLPAPGTAARRGSTGRAWWA